MAKLDWERPKYAWERKSNDDYPSSGIRRAFKKKQSNKQESTINKRITQIQKLLRDFIRESLGLKMNIYGERKSATTDNMKSWIFIIICGKEHLTIICDVLQKYGAILVEIEETKKYRNMNK